VNVSNTLQKLIPVALVVLCVAAFAHVFQNAGSPATGASFATWNRATPALSLKDNRGSAHTLDEFRGRVVLVHFWATWCEPCREELPSISGIAQRYAPQGLALVAVDVGESRAGIVRFTEQVPIAGLVLEDRNSEVFKQWRAQVLPATYLVGRDGRVRSWQLGEVDWTDAKTIQRVEALLGEGGGRQQESNLPGSG
jgi:thiol-disulfide isomerase/thioredoxin